MIWRRTRFSRAFSCCCISAMRALRSWLTCFLGTVILGLLRGTAVRRLYVLYGGHPRCPPTARDCVGDGLLGPVLDAQVAAGPVRGRRWSEPGSGRPDVSTRARRHHLARHPDAAPDG